MAIAARIRLAWGLFALFSLIAVLTGCWAARAHGASSQVLLLNLAAWVVGALLAAETGLVRAPVSPALLGLALVALALTLISPGLSGVHRWIVLGPVRLNAAELLLPAALAACAGLDSRSLPHLLFPLAVAMLLVLQPDISQAAATAAAGLVLTATSGRPLAVKVPVALGLAAATVAAALRPDPLGPVPTVEGIVRLAAQLSPGLAGLGVAAILGAVLAPLALLQVRPPQVREAALTLTVCLAVAAAAPAAGAFPVPLMGMGPSPILGAWLALGVLTHLAHRSRERFVS